MAKDLNEWDNLISTHILDKTEESKRNKLLLEYTKNLTEALSSATDLRYFMQLLLEGINKAVGFDRVRIYAIDHRKNSLKAFLALGVEDFEGKEKPIHDDKVTRAIFQQKRAELFLTFPDDPFAAELHKRPGETVFAAVPIILDGEAIGMITADNLDSNKTIDRSQLGDMQMFANNAALAIKHFNLVQSLDIDIYSRLKEVEFANAQLQQFNEKKDHFLRYVSHEMRTPLTSIIGYSQILQEGDFSAEEIKSSLKVINEEGQRLLSMLNNILDFEKIKAGKITVKQEMIEFYPYLSGILALLKANALRKNIQLSLDCSKHQTAYADPNLMKQVINNIVGNAIKFTPEGGRIAVKSYDEGNILNIIVEDTGPGIAMSDIPKIFEQFKQLNHSDPNIPKGTGLGLPIAKEIVEAHGGTIKVESELGRGTRFIIKIARAS